MSAEVQPAWTGLGALLSAGAGLFLLQVCGEALFHGSFLPLCFFLVGFARVCSSHNDAERSSSRAGTDTLSSLAKRKVKGQGEILYLL